MEPERRAIGVEVTRVTIAVTALITVGTILLPSSMDGTFVGLAFLAAVWLLIWQKDDTEVARYGVAIGGLMLHERPALLTMAREAVRAMGWALAIAAICFIPYYFGWKMWHAPHTTFAPSPHPLGILNTIAGQLLLVALPEEAFYRGYLQTRLDEVFPKTLNILGAKLGISVLITSAIFAIGHFLTIPSPERLAVFFPSLAFGWLRARTGGIGAAAAFHTACNLLDAGLGAAYSLY